MSRETANTLEFEQLPLPIKSPDALWYWEYFTNHPKNSELARIACNLASSHEHRTKGEHEQDIRQIQITLGERGLASYGLKSVEHGLIGNGHHFAFEFADHHVDWTVLNEKVATVRAWDLSLNKRARMAVWKTYREKLREVWGDPEPGQQPSQKSRLEDRLYTIDTELQELCYEHSFKEINLRTSHAPIFSTELAFPAALHLVEMPLEESYPIIGPGQGDIEVIKPGVIIPHSDRHNSHWHLDSDDGKFTKE